MRQLVEERSALRLRNEDFLDLSPDAQAGTLPIESITIVLLSQLLQGLVTVSHELSEVTPPVATISEDNEILREELHDISSQLANLPHTQQQQTSPGIADLQASIRDLSHRVSAPIPAPRHFPPPHTRHPNRIQLPAPPLRRRVKKGPLHHPHFPQPRLTNLKYLIPFYDTRLGKAFGDPAKYARLYPNSYQAGEFRKGRSDLASFTPGHLHLDAQPPTSYARAASGSGWGGKGKSKVVKPPSPQLVASAAAAPVKKGPPSLPGAQRRFFAPRRPLPLTQRLPLLPLPFPPSLLASSANQTASTP